MLVDKHKSAVFDGGRTDADHFLECTHTRAPKGAIMFTINLFIVVLVLTYVLVLKTKQIRPV